MVVTLVICVAAIISPPLRPHAAQWIIAAARKRKARGGMEDGLAQELVQASQGKGAAVGRREAVHKTAVANQVLLRYTQSASRNTCHTVHTSHTRARTHAHTHTPMQAQAHFRWRAGSGKDGAEIDMDAPQYRPIGRRSIKRLQPL